MAKLSRYVGESTLNVVRIEVHRYKNDIIHFCGRLRIKDDLFVLYGLKTQVLTLRAGHDFDDESGLALLCNP